MRQSDAPTVEPSRVLPCGVVDRYFGHPLLSVGPNAKDACGDDPVIRFDNNPSFHRGARYNNSQTISFFTLRHWGSNRHGVRHGNKILSNGGE